ncbi:MAG: ATP-binding protein [Gammaproteobacteria bacterium]
MQDFEKLGSFYLGRRVDDDAQTLSEEAVLYDARDLTTHAVIIGMTGSGKTGLGIGLIEEAVMDNVPVIAIDPKGDMGNLLLTFPKLDGASFEPWVDGQAATTAGKSVGEYATAQAKLWRDGLKKWGQDGKRIAALKSKADFSIYTPGSSAGAPVSVLSSFAAPPAAVIDDPDIYRDKVAATATGILNLVGIDADPITSREHILLSNILDFSWRDGKSLDLGGLIGAIQNPPVKRVGVMDLDAFFPAKDRFALAMRLNNLLGAPGFDAWMKGEPLNTGSLLYTPAGKPRVSIMSIAHLDDAQRMFFVTMLLADIISWMRAQPGTGSLRAVLYMDEIFGYMPPTANPPSKRLLLTLLKQARAFGLGLVLSTQNPVDLDYKGLSNTGTWFIGRLQTERDKLRVMEGLEGAADGARFDKARMERVLAGLGKRRFLLHNVHEDGDVVFNTRWAMSYLPGPLTRSQVKTLMSNKPVKVPETAISKAPKGRRKPMGPPIVEPGVKQFYVPARLRGDGELVYQPRALGVADLTFANARYGVDLTRQLIVGTEFGVPPVVVDWAKGAPLGIGLEDLETSPLDEVGYLLLATEATKAKSFTGFEKLFKRWIKTDNVLNLYRSKVFKLVSTAQETEGDFRVRLQMTATEQRDVKVAALRQKYATKIAALDEKLRKANQTLEKEQEQASQKKMDSLLGAGTAILGVLLGRKKLSATSASKMRRAVSGFGSSRKEAGDVERAKETILKIEQTLEDTAERLQAEVDALELKFDVSSEELQVLTIKPKSTDTFIHAVGIVWVPFYRATDGKLSPAA